MATVSPTGRQPVTRQPLTVEQRLAKLRVASHLASARKMARRSAPGPGRMAAEVAQHYNLPVAARALLLALLLLSPLAALTVDGYALGASYHYTATDRAELHGWNPGAGLGVSTDCGDGWEATAMAIVYRDSFGRTAVAGGGGGRYTVGNRQAWHGSAAVLLGYLNGSGMCGPIAVPIAGIGYGAVNVEASAGPDAAAVWLRLAWRLP